MSAQTDDHSQQRVNSVVVVWFLSSFLLMLGALIGFSTLARPEYGQRANSLAEALGNWDGRWYASIIEEGYSFTPEKQSNVAFFPVYPLAALAVKWTTGMSASGALVLVANISTLACFLLARAYVLERYGASKNVGRSSSSGWVTMAMAYFPTTFFFRMAYSESTFLLFVILTLYGISKRWPAIWIALIVGLATAARPVGIVLLLPFAIYLWREHAQKVGQKFWEANPFLYVRRFALLALACWGIVLYTLFLYGAFGEPLAWVHAHETWRVRPETNRVDELLAVTSHEPLWSPYCPTCHCYWRKPGQPTYAVFSLRFLNSIYFLIGVSALGVGMIKRWLTVYEVLLGVGLLLLPYLSVGYIRCMEEQGRYASVVFPMYLVLGQLLDRLPTTVAAAIVALSGFFLAINAGMFAAGYVFI